ncbi:MAG: hypothetical protein ABIZ50_04225, partial [Solirubrobacterales bacterium]
MGIAAIFVALNGGGEAAPATAERSKDLVLTPDGVDRSAARAEAPSDPGSNPKVVELRGAGAKPEFTKRDGRGSSVSPGA